MNDTKKEIGLSKENRNFLVSLVFALLLLFGPIDPYGIVIRTIYLIAIPILLYFFLKIFGERWQIDEVSNDYINRTIVSYIAGALLVGAYLSMTAKYHTECNQYVQTRDGQECVGDYVTVKGSDKSGAFIQIILASFAIWYAVTKRQEETERPFYKQLKTK